MDCNISSCVFYMVIASLSAVGLFIAFYIIFYIFLALDVNWNHSHDLKKQRARTLSNIVFRYW